MVCIYAHATHMLILESLGYMDSVGIYIILLFDVVISSVIFPNTYSIIKFKTILAGMGLQSKTLNLF